MLDVMQFIFSSIWTFFGTILLIASAGGALGIALQPLRRNAVTVNNYNQDGTHE